MVSAKKKGRRARLDAPPPYLDKIVRAAADQADERGIRAVARDVGMSPSGLTKVLNGNFPYAPTMRKLRKWAIRQAGLVLDEGVLL